MKYFASMLFCSLCAAGCGTLTPFLPMTPDYSAVPKEGLAALADSIERAVAAGDKDAEITAPANVTLADPGVRQTIRTRALRHERISALLDAGYAYELRSGLLKMRNTKEYMKATTRQERDRNAQTVQAENQDRWTLYEGLTKENHWPSRSLGAVQFEFFQARVKYLSAGQDYESSEGTPTAK